jgi:hypothetical protein
LIAAGHPPAAVWHYTPREIAGFLGLARARRRRGLGEQLAIAAAGQRAEPKALQRLLQRLGRE